MSMFTLESAILQELRQITGKRSLRRKDIMEWSTGKVDVVEGETIIFIPKYGIYASVLTSVLPKTYAT